MKTKQKTKDQVKQSTPFCLCFKGCNPVTRCCCCCNLNLGMYILAGLYFLSAAGGIYNGIEIRNIDNYNSYRITYNYTQERVDKIKLYALIMYILQFVFAAIGIIAGIFGLLHGQSVKLAKTYYYTALLELIIYTLVQAGICACNVLIINDCEECEIIRGLKEAVMIIYIVVFAVLYLIGLSFGTYFVLAIWSTFKWMEAGQFEVVVNGARYQNQVVVIQNVQPQQAMGVQMVNMNQQQNQYQQQNLHNQSPTQNQYNNGYNNQFNQQNQHNQQNQYNQQNQFNQQLNYQKQTSNHQFNNNSNMQNSGVQKQGSNTYEKQGSKSPKTFKKQNLH